MIREAIDKIHREIICHQLTKGAAQIDGEIAHESALALMGNTTENRPALLALMNRFFTYNDPALKKQVFGLEFRNPLGMAAGFDKNGRVVLSLGAQGFGFVEVGTMTKIKYEGNPRFDSKGKPTPRIFRLDEDDSLINRLGFPGDGVGQNVARLRAKLPPKDWRQFKVAGNIGASKPSFEEGKAVEHYVEAFKDVPGDLVDFKVVNVSSPNTKGVTNLQDPAIIEEMLTAIDAYQVSYPDQAVPYLLKFGPDLTTKQYDNLLNIILKHKTSGIVLTSTTTNSKLREHLISQHKNEPGGLSGRALTGLTLSIGHHVHEVTEGKLPMILVGGIMTSQDYINALTYGGADLVEVYASYVNRRISTPNLPYYFNRDLRNFMRTRSMTSVADLE